MGQTGSWPGKIQLSGIWGSPGASSICHVHGGPLRMLRDFGTCSIFGCTLTCNGAQKDLKALFPEKTDPCLVLLLQPAPPGQSMPPSSRKVIPPHLRLHCPCSSAVCHNLAIRKRLALSPSWTSCPHAITRVLAVEQQCSPCTYMGAERLTGWQPPGTPEQGCRDIDLKLGWTFLMRSLRY